MHRVPPADLLRELVAEFTVRWDVQFERLVDRGLAPRAHETAGDHASGPLPETPWLLRHIRFGTDPCRLRTRLCQTDRRRARSRRGRSSDIRPAASEERMAVASEKCPPPRAGPRARNSSVLHSAWALANRAMTRSYVRVRRLKI